MAKKNPDVVGEPDDSANDVTPEADEGQEQAVVPKPDSDEAAAPESEAAEVAEAHDAAEADPAAADMEAAPDEGGPAGAPQPAPTDVAALQAELDRLKSENEHLREEVVSAPRSHAGMRTGWALALALVAALLLGLAVPAVWLNRTVMETETWVATVAPLAQDPAIQDAVAKLASDRIIEALDAEARLVELLPDALDRFAPILASSANQFITTQATTIVRSEQFPQIWEDINRAGHKALIAALTGERSGGAVIYTPGVLTLDVGVLAEQIQTRLAEKVPFLSRIPVGSINKQVEIFNSPALAQASLAIAAMNRIALLLPLFALAIAAGAFALAADRRKVALWLGSAIIVITVLPLQAIYLGQIAVVGQLQKLADIPTAAAQNAYDIIFAGLVSAETTIAVLGVVVLLAALAAGPSKWAVAMRGAVSGGIGNVAGHLELGAFGTWIAAHKSGMRTIGIIGAVLILLAMPAPRTIAQIIWVAVLGVVWVLIVELLGAGPAAKQDDATEPPQAV